MAVGNSANKAVGQVLFGTFAGGITAELSGGNFWQGAATGMVVSLLNHVGHEITEPKTKVIGIYGAGGKNASGNPALEKLVRVNILD